MRRAAELLAYLAAFLLLTHPLGTDPLHAVVGHWTPDLEHSLWVQWWLATALASPEHDLFRSSAVVFPHEVDLQLADLNLAINLPVHLFGRLLPGVGAYNLSLLLSFLLSAWLVRGLALRLAASPDAAWLAGLVFAGSSYWVASALNGWCYLVHAWPLPLVLVAALALRDRPSPRSGAGLGAALGLAFHVTPYYLLFAAVMLVLLAAARPARLRAHWRRPGLPAALVVAGLVAAALVAPRAWPMALAAQQGLVVHHGPLNTELAAPVAELVWPSSSAVQSRLPRLGYLVVFVGYTTLALAAWSLRREVAGRGTRRLLSAAAVLLLLALGPRLVITGGQATGLPLPGDLLQRLPAFDLTTNHWRWVAPASLCLALVIATTLTVLEEKLAASRPRLAAAVLPLAAAVYAFEAMFVWPLPYPRPLERVEPSPAAHLLRGRTDVRAVLDRTDRRKLNQTVHERPIALGWLPRMDVATWRANQALVDDCSGRLVECLPRHGIDAIVQDPHTVLLLHPEGGIRQVLRTPH